MKQAAVAVLLIVLAGLLAVIVNGRGESDAPLEPHAVLETKVESGVPAVEESVKPEVASTAAADAAPSRSEIEGDGEWVCRVEDAEGLGLDGALVTWTPLEALRATAVSAPGPADSLVAVSTLRVTLASGTCAFPANLRDREGVLWVTRPGYSAEGMQFAALEQGSDGLLVVVLRESADVSIRVVDREGQPVEGARVTETGYRGGNLGLGEGSGRPLKVQAFFREGVTNESGEVALPSGVTFVRFQASKGGLTSQSVIKAAQGETDLVLGETVQAGGTLRGLAGLGSAVVVVSSRNPNGALRFLETLDVDGQGQILARPVPLIPNTDYVFQVEGPEIEPFVVDALRPKGDSVLIDAAVEAAAHIGIRFSNEAGEPVEGVKVKFIWNGDDGSVYKTGAYYLSDPDGRVRIACKAGAVYPIISHPNYLPLYLAKGLIGSTSNDDEYEITLQEFGSLEGFVTRLGKPVKDFDLLYYRESPDVDMETLHIRDSEDGSYRVSKAPTGSITVFAVAKGGGAQAEPQTVNVMGGQSTDCLLEIPLGGLGVGRVVAADGSVPSGIKIQRHLKTGSSVPWGAEEMIQAEADGSFAVPGLAASQEALSLTASGFGNSVAQASRKADGGYDFGLTVMEKAESLDLRVLLAPDAKPEDFTLQTTGGLWSDPQRLSRDGHLVFEGLTPGYLTAKIADIEGVGYEFSMRLTGEGPWIRTIDLSGEASLAVQIEGVLSELPAGVWVEAQIGGRGEQSEGLVYAGVSEEGRALLHHLSAIPLTVQLRGPDWEVLAGGTATPAGGEPPVLGLAIGREDWVVQVVDRSGAPLQGVTVNCRVLANPASQRSVLTNEDGLAKMGASMTGLISFTLAGPDGGWASGIEFEASEMSSPLRLTFDASSDLNLEILDGKAPLEGAELWLWDPHFQDVLAWPRVAAGGSWDVNSLAEGNYLIEPVSTGIWYERKPIHCDGTGKIQEVQFRRKAGVRIAVKDAYGNPAAGVAVGLRSVEYDTDVAVWLGDGRGESATGLVTDASGEAIVSEVPRGIYSWSVDSQVGQVDAPALGEGVVEVTLKP